MTGNHYRKAGNKGNVVQCQCFVKSVKDNRGHHASLGNKPPQQERKLLAAMWSEILINAEFLNIKIGRSKIIFIFLTVSYLKFHCFDT